MSILRMTIALVLAALFAVGPGIAATGSWNGIAFTAWNGIAITSWNGTSISAGGGGGLAAFSDDFNRADSDSLGANWTEADGDIDIFSNTARLGDGSFGENFAIYTATSCTTVNQYIKLTIVTENNYPQIPIRYTNSSSPFYYIEFSNSSVDWFHTTQIGGTDTQINSSPGTVSLYPGVVIGIAISGTGSSTEVKIWIDPGSGTDPTTWGAADVTFTDNPPSPVDTGGYVGIGGVQSAANSVRYENFYGGDTP